MTIDGSGRCHDHRSARQSAEPAPRAAPVLRVSVSSTAPTRHVRERFPNGSVKKVEWELGGRLHRLDGPASLRFYPNGKIYRELYYRHGLEHRIDGPSSVTYAPDGSELTPEYSLIDAEVESLEALHSSLATWPDQRLREEFEESRFAPLIAEGVEPTVILGCLRDGVRTNDGIREVARGAPLEWVRAYEEAAYR